MKTFKATKVSGAEASLFAGSVLPFVVEQSNKRNIFKFPFYGVSFDMQKSRWEEWIREDEYITESKRIIKYVAEHGFKEFQKIKQLCTQESNELAKLSLEMVSRIATTSDNELGLLYKQFIEKYIPYYGLGAVTFVYESVLSEELTSSLSQRHQHAGDLAMKLLQSDYKSFMLGSELLLAKIKSSEGKIKDDLVDKYLQSFFFIKTNYRYAEIINSQIVLEMAQHAHQPQKMAPIPDVELNELEKNIIELFKITEAIRDQRKKTNQIGSYTLFRFLEELEKRTNLSHETAAKATYLEFGQMLKGDRDFIHELGNRKAYSFAYDGIKVYQGDELELVDTSEISGQITEIKGMVAAKGKVQGIARVVIGQGDFAKVKDGDIIVAQMTRPDFMPILKRAAAFITDEGGLTCHAAIVAREMNKPCIIGTKIATKVLKDGDMVEVDADKGIVRITE